MKRFASLRNLFGSRAAALAGNRRLKPSRRSRGRLAVAESLERRSMLAVTPSFNPTTGILTVDMTDSDNSVAFEFGVFSDGGTPATTSLGVRLSSSTQPAWAVFPDVAGIQVLAASPSTVSGNRASFGIMPFDAAFDLSSFVYEGGGITGAGHFRADTGTFAASTAISLSGIDVVSFSQADEIRLDGTFTNDTGDATIQVAYQSFNADVSEVIIGTNGPLEADFIRIESSKAITFFNPVTATEDVTLRTQSLLDLDYDVTSGGTLVLDGTGGVTQQASSTIVAPRLEVVNRAATAAASGDIALGSANNDFDIVYVTSSTTGKVAIRDQDDLNVAESGILATSAQVVIDAGGLLTLSSMIKADGLFAQSKAGIVSTTNAVLELGDQGLTLLASDTFDPASTGDITLAGPVYVNDTDPAVLVANKIVAAGTATIAGGIYSPLAGTTTISGGAGVVIAGPVQVGSSKLNATSTTLTVYDHDLTLVAADGSIEVRDVPGNDAVPRTIQATNIVSFDAANAVTIAGSVFAGTLYGNPLALVETKALPAITIRSGAAVTLAATGSLQTSSYENDADLHPNPLLGLISITEADQVNLNGSVVADGAVDIDVVGDIYLYGPVTARESITAATTTGSFDVQGAIRSTGSTYTTTLSGSLLEQRTPDIRLSAPLGSITTSGLGTLRSGVMLVGQGQVFGEIELDAQQDIVIGANILGAQDVRLTTTLGAVEIDARVEAANKGTATLKADSGVTIEEFGAVEAKLLQVVNASSGEVNLVSLASNFASLDVVNRAPLGDVNVGVSQSVEIVQIQADGDVTVTGDRSVTVDDVEASGDITLTAVGQMAAEGTIVARTGDITIASAASSVELSTANLLASSGAITITAHGVVNQPSSTGVVEVRGQSTGLLAAATAPEVTVTIAAPASGTGTAATARATVVRIDTLADGGGIFIDPFGNVVVIPPSETPVWGVVGVTLTNPGSGYAPNERPLVTFTGIPNAVYEAFAAGSRPTNIVAAEGVSITGGGKVLLSSVVQSNAGDITIASVSGNLDLSANTFFAHALDGSVVLESDCGTVVVEQVCAEDEVVISAEKGVTIENDIDAGGDITVIAASGLVDSAQSNKQITSRDGAITVGGRTVFLGPMLANKAINVDAQGAIVVTAVTSQADSFSVVSRSDSISLSGAIVAESVTGTAQREFAVLAPVTARTGDVTIVANDGTVALQADVTAVKGDIDLTGRAILQGGLGVAKVVVDPLDPTGKILGQKAGEGYSAATTKVVISAPRRGGSAAQAVPIVGKVRVGTTEESETVDDKTVTRQVPVFSDSGIVQLILTSPGSGYEVGEPVTVTFIDPNVESEASATVTLQSVVPNAALVADSGEVRLKATTEALTVQTIKAGSSVALNANNAVTVTDSIVSGGEISLTSPAGGVTARDLLAVDGITIDGFEDARLSGQIHTKTGDIDIRSTGGSVNLAANVLASDGDVVLKAHHDISQSQNGLDKIVITFGGDGYTSPIVTVSPPRGGGTAATARAIVSTEAPGPVLAIEILTPGSGYAPGEFVTVTIEQGANRSAAAYGIASTSDPKIVAGGKVELLAGGDVSLVNEVRADSGGITIDSTDGNVDLSAVSLLLHSKGGAVSIGASGGTVNLGKVIAQGDIEARATQPLTVSGTVVSKAGDVTFVSKAGLVSLNSIVTAELGSIDVSAFSTIESRSGGVSRVEVLTGGLGYNVNTTQIVFAPPGGTIDGQGVVEGGRLGGRAATGRVNVDQQGRVVGVEIVDPGTGYIPGEAVGLAILGDGDGAISAAYVDQPLLVLAAGKNVLVTGGDDVNLVGTIRSTQAGNVVVSSLSGDITLDSDSTLLQAIDGDVSVIATAGSVALPQISAGKAVNVAAKTDVALRREVDAGTGDVTITTTHGDLALSSSDASIVSAAGGITLASQAGLISSPKVLKAEGDITLESLGQLTLNGEIVATRGAIALQSNAGNVDFRGVVSAEKNSVTLDAFAAIKSFRGGVTRIDVVNAGTGYVQAFTRVFVIKNGESVNEQGVVVPDPDATTERENFRPATARAIINEDGETTAFEIIDAGRGYLELDDVRVVVRDTRGFDATGSGASALAFVDPSSQTLSAFGNATVVAGRDIELVGPVRSVEGNVGVTSKSGNLDLALLQAFVGDVVVSTAAGQATVERITAGGDVDIQAKLGVEVSTAIDSAAGDISLATTHGDLELASASLVAKAGSIDLTSTAGQIYSPMVLNAFGAIDVKSLSTIFLNGFITATLGAVNVQSAAGDVQFNAVISAEGNQAAVKAFGNVKSFEGGVSRLELVAGGTGYVPAFTQVIVIKNGESVNDLGVVVPDPAETNTREDFRQATVVAEVSENGQVAALRILDAGSGYLQSDSVRLVIRDPRGARATGSGAGALAFVDPSVQTLSALGRATVQAGGDVELIGFVRSLEGDVVVNSVTGDLNLQGSGVVLQALQGDVTVVASAGEAGIRRITAGGDVAVQAKTGVILTGKVDTTSGNIALSTTHGSLDLSLPGASLVANDGAVSLLSVAGSIETPDAISATDGVEVSGFGQVVLNGRIASSGGAIKVESRSGDVDVNAVVESANGTVAIEALANVISRDGGVSRFDVVTSGANYSRDNTLVYVLFEDEEVTEDGGNFVLESGDIATARGETFRRAAARAILDEKGAIVAVEIVDRGRGYLPTDRLSTQVFDTRSEEERVGAGATLVTYVDPSAQTLSAGSDLTVKAGDDITLIGITRSVAGDVTVESTSGNITLSAADAVLQAVAGDVQVAALAGEAAIRQVAAFGDVAISGSRGVEIIRSVESAAGDITIVSNQGDVDLDAVTQDGGVRIRAQAGAIRVESATGVINTPETLRAGSDITIKSLGTVELANSIVSDAGNISVEGEAARMTLNAVIKATEGSVNLKSNSDLDDVGGGLTRIDMVNFGLNYSNQTTVRVAAPRNGGDPARVRPIIENGRIVSLEIIYPGKGYEPGETVVLIGDDVFVDFPEGPGDQAGRGAEAVGFSDSPTQSIEAKESITIETRDDLKMFGILRAQGAGGISLQSRAGDVDLIGANRTSMVADATQGPVTIAAPAGAARVNDLLAATTVNVTAEQDITVIGLVRATEQSVRLESTSGDVVVQDEGKLHAVAGSVTVLATRGDAKVQNLFAGQNISLETLGDVKLTEALNTAVGDLTIVTKAGIDNAGTVETGGSINLTASLGVTSLGGGIVRIDLLSGGANYEYAIVTIAGPASGGGRAATARATINEEGVITSIAILDPGYGYATGEVVNVRIEGQEERPSPSGGIIPAGVGARAVAVASQTSSSLIAGQSIAIKAGTIADVTNEMRATAGGVAIDVSAGPLKVSEIYAAENVALTAAQTISLGGLLRTAGGDVAIESTGGSFDMRGIIRAPGGKVEIETAGQMVQRGASISRDKIYLLSGGSGYTSAQVIVDPPPGAGEAALARAVITDPDPFDDDDTGYISEIILLDAGWGYPSDSRVNVRIIGEGGTGAAAVFGTELINSAIEAKDDVTLTGGDDITLVSTVRSAAGNVNVLATLGDVSVESITAGLAVDVTSARGEVTLVSVAATQDATITADQGVLISDSLSTVEGDISIETTNGDITFVKELVFIDDFIVDDTIGAIEPRAVISSKAGDIAITAHNGAIVTPYVINAGGDVSLSSLLGMDLTNQITSQGGDINVESTSGLVRVKSNMVAEAGSITVEAQTTLQQEFVSGISKIELLSPGPSQVDPPAVTVTVAAPRNGGEAATAYAIIEKRQRREQIDLNPDDPFNNVIEYEYFISYIAIINPGYGYDVGENPIVTITGVNGATARAYGPTMVGMISAKEDVNLLAGENITLITKIHAVEGNVTVASQAGDIDLTADSLFLSAKAGGIDIDAYGGSVDLQRAQGFGDVTVDAAESINVLRSVMSENGGIRIASTNNALYVRQLNAKENVVVSGFKTSTVGEIASASGDVVVASTAGGLRLKANIVAGGDVSLDAQTFVQQLDPTGLEAVEIVGEGSIRQVTLTPVPPTVTVTIAPPAAGGRAASAQAVLARRFLGNNPVGNIPIWEFYIKMIEIVDPGSGYALGENPIVTIGEIPGAVARAFGPSSMQNITGGGDISIEAGADIRLANVVRSISGDITIGNTNGALDLAGADLRAMGGSIALNAAAGTAILKQATAAGDVKIEAHGAFTLLGVVDSETGDVAMTSRAGNLDFTAFGALIYAEEGGVTLLANNGTILTAPTLNVAEDVTIKSLNTVALRNEITSDRGDIAVESISGSITTNANINAITGSVTLDAHGAITQLGRGIHSVEVLTGGSGYNAATTITIAAPVGGGVTATARPVIGANGAIIGIVIVNPGSGYGVNEQPLVTITPASGFPPASGANALAHVTQGVIAIAAGQNVTIDAGNGVTLINPVNTVNGDIAITTVNGKVDASGAGVIGSQNGGVAIDSANGTILLAPVIKVAGDIKLAAGGSLSLVNDLTSVVGSISLESRSGAITLGSLEAAADLIAEERITLSARTGINQANGFIKARELVALNATTQAVSLNNVSNDVENVSIRSLGAVSYTDANDFETGVDGVTDATVVVQEFTVVNGGTNYDQEKVDVLVAAPAAVGGIAARARAEVQNGVITRIVMTTPGSGYVDGEMPAVTIRNMQGGTGAGAVATAVSRIQGVERVAMRASTLNLTSIAPHSTIRVVGGLEYARAANGTPVGLSINAGATNGESSGRVEYVTTASFDNPAVIPGGLPTFAGTLRDMILYANDNAASFVINGSRRQQPQAMVFDDADYAVSEITVAAALPRFTRTVTFDGGASATGRLGLWGSAAAADGLAFGMGSSESRVTTVAAYGFAEGAGIALFSGGNVVTDVYAGVMADGETRMANRVGIDVNGTAAIGNMIGDRVFDEAKVNRIVGNRASGIVIRNGATTTNVSGNRIYDNLGDGVRIVNSVGNLIGDPRAVQPDMLPTDSNVIAGNRSNGILVRNSVPGSLATANRIRNNRIEANQGLNIGLGAGAGISIQGSKFAVIGGPTEGAGNTIVNQRSLAPSAAGVHGIAVSDSTDVRVIGVGNSIGVDLNTLTRAPNSGDGINIVRSQRVEISDRNTIAGNAGNGITIGSGSSGVTVLGNSIGLAAADPTRDDLGNSRNGVAINDAVGNTVGAGNAIAFNGFSGVNVANARAATLAAGNRVLGSEIFANFQNGVRIAGGSGTTVGGTRAGEANVIRGNLGSGIQLERTEVTGAATGNLIQGNVIGTNVNRDIDAALGNKQGGIRIVAGTGNTVANGNVIMNNQRHGVELQGGSGNVVGGATAAVGNMIASNAASGVRIGAAAGAPSTMVAARNHVVAGNTIVDNAGNGVDVDGIGVTVTGVVGATIGQTVTATKVSGVGNVIEGNKGVGINVGRNAQQVSFQGNLIADNDAGAVFVAAGANRSSATAGTFRFDRQVWDARTKTWIADERHRDHVDQSVILRSSAAGPRLEIYGTFSNPAAKQQQYSIDVYANSPYDAEGPGGVQQRRLLGRVTVMADANGVVDFRRNPLAITAPVEAGEVITMTATSLRFEPGSTVVLSSPMVVEHPGIKQPIF